MGFGWFRPGPRTSETKSSESELARPVRQAVVMAACSVLACNLMGLALWLWQPEWGVVKWASDNPRRYVVITVVLPVIGAILALFARMKQEIWDPGFDSPNPMITRPVPMTGLIRFMMFVSWLRSGLKAEVPRDWSGGLGASTSENKGPEEGE